MRKIILFAAAMAVSLASKAETVEATAGQLSQLVDDTQITSLVITGTMDARDFHFIGQSLTLLTELDLSAVEIVAYDDPQAELTGSATSFSARSIPAVLLMDMPFQQLVLPANLERIGQAAFAGCLNLEVVTLPETLKEIASYAFSGTGLKQVVVPDSVRVLGEGAFSRCLSLESAVIPSQEIGAYAFLGDVSLASVSLADAVTTIGRGAFSGCVALNQLAWNVTSELATIGDEAFLGSGVTTFDFGSLAHLSSVGNFAFASTPLQQAILPSGMKLGEGAFYYADSIAEAILPSDITSVPAYTFSGLSKATTAQPMSEGVSIVGDYAFYDWSAAQYFTLPSTVQYIGTKAMAGMTGLQKLEVLGDVAQLGDSVWAYVDQPAVKLDVINGSIADFEAAIQWRDFYILHSFLLGDVNLDGNVDVVDVSATIAYVLGEELETFFLMAADINNDGRIDVQDVSAIIDLILNGEDIVIKYAQGQGGSQSQYPWTSDRLSIENITMNASHTATLPVKLDNRQTYTALQCDVILPEGVTVDPDLSQLTARASNYSLLVSPNEYGCRVLMYSAANEAMPSGEGAIFNLALKSDGESSGSMRIANVILVDRHQGYLANSVEACIDNLTGVDDMNAPMLAVTAGKGFIEVQSAQAGTMQVVAMNGASRMIDVQSGTTTIEMAPGVYVVRMGTVSKKVQVK